MSNLPNKQFTNSNLCQIPQMNSIIIQNEEESLITKLTNFKNSCPLIIKSIIIFNIINLFINLLFQIKGTFFLLIRTFFIFFFWAPLGKQIEITSGSGRYLLLFFINNIILLIPYFPIVNNLYFLSEINFNFTLFETLLVALSNKDKHIVVIKKKISFKFIIYVIPFISLILVYRIYGIIFTVAYSILYHKYLINKLYLNDEIIKKFENLFIIKLLMKNKSYIKIFDEYIPIIENNIQNNENIYDNNVVDIQNQQNVFENINEISIYNYNSKNTNHSTESTTNFSGNIFLSDSLKLSSYIKTYYQKNNTYPETLLTFYKYGRIIGQGAFGKVNLGLNTLTGRVVAIKSFNKQSLDNENKKKILYETNLMKKLNHPNITKILELFESEKYILLIMEYINGGNLFSFVKKRRKLNEKTSKFLFKQIILGIKYIHSQNIVHRDIKLENILIDIKNNIKICDFGISKILNLKEKLYDQCGTPMYMAPEIFLSNKEKGYEPYPIDLWSAGIALYIMLSGTLPFCTKNDLNEKDKFSLRNSIINSEFKPIENISNEALDLLNGLLRKDPKKRFKINDVLNHPWLKNNFNNYNNNNYHLFTKAEIVMMNQTYIDYRFAKNEDIKENFTMSNLNSDDISKEEINQNTKSIILAPYNTIKHFNNYYDDDFDEINVKIKLENHILLFGNKVKEFNRNYELNNNGECDNGILINTKSSNSINSIINNSANLNLNDNIVDDDNEKNKKNDFYLSKEDEEKRKEKILSKIEELGYDKNYTLEKLKSNELCHVTAVYYLMMNYENI